MKKGILFFAILIVFFNFLAISGENKSAMTGSSVTGETVNGKVTESGVSLSIIIIASSVSLEILQPKNNTYFTSQNLLINFSALGADNSWYTFDSGFTNISISGNIKFNTTEGNHTLFLYANNSVGIVSQNVTFFVNSTKFNVKYNKYLGTRKGASTYFNSSSYEDVQNLSGVILEDTEYGKISFNENINNTGDSNFSDNFVDLDSYTNLSFNRIEINSTALPNFNKSATLSLYNLTFTTPRILKDGNVCDSAVCAQQSYAGGTLVFNVTAGFSIYSTEETPAAATAPTANTGGNTGGGGSGIIYKIFPKRGIILSVDNIKAKLKQGEVTMQKLIITNENTVKTKISVENSRLKDFLIISDSDFDLNPGESKEISIDIIARENTNPDLYLGKLVVKSYFEQKEIYVAVEVASKNALLDVKVEILKDYIEVLPGDDILAEISLFNLGSKSRTDVLIEFILKDFNGKEVARETESLAVETQTSFVRKLTVPNNADYGKYILYVRAMYNNEVASASNEFNVVSLKVTTNEKIFISMATVIIIIMSALLIYHYTREKPEMRKKRKLELNDLIRRSK